MTVEIEPTTAVAGRRRRWPVTLVCWVLALPVGLWAAARLLGLDHGPLVQLLAFTPYVAAWAVLAAVGTLALRRWRPAAVAVIAAVALAACVLPRAIGDPGPARNGPGVRVLTANLLIGAGDPGTLVGLVRDRQVDVLAVQEFTPEAAARLDAAGLATLLPYRLLVPEVGTSGSGLLSRHPLRDAGIRRPPGGFAQAYAAVLVPGAPPVLVESVHAAAPYAVSALGDWRASLRAEPRAEPNGPVRILIGDFNATLDHGPLREIVASGYVDAADAVGAGLIGTWGPYDGDRIPPVTIDHVLVDRRVGVHDVQVLTLPNSDHRPVFAELSLPAG